MKQKPASQKHRTKPAPKLEPGVPTAEKTKPSIRTASRTKGSKKK